MFTCMFEEMNTAMGCGYSFSCSAITSYVVAGEISFDGISYEDAVASPEVFVSAIAEAADVDDSLVTVSISAARRRALSSGVVVDYTIAVVNEDAGDALVSDLETVSTSEFEGYVTAAAADEGVSAEFASMSVEAISAAPMKLTTLV